MNLKDQIKQIPFARKLHWQLTKFIYRQRFAHDGYGSFLGVFNTFEEAIKSAPKTKNIGYNHRELATEYAQMLEDENWEGSGRIIANYDYPILFWLGQIINETMSQTVKHGCEISVFDFGGNVGIHFYAYRSYIDRLKELPWMVCEVAEIAKVGRAIAQKRNVQNLKFTSEFADLSGKDVLIASGSIQYVQNLAQQLSISNKPVHLLINRLPLYEGEDFVTLQNGGKVFYPQYVFSKAKFIADLNRIGYKLIDIWEDKHDSCIIPSHPEKSLPFYYGIYLRLESINQAVLSPILGSDR